MDKYMISIMVFLVFIFVARTINDRANRKLASEKKAELVDLFSKSRTLTFGALIAIIGLYFLALKYQTFEPIITLTLYVVLLLIFIVYNAIIAQQKLRSSEFPEDFIKSFLLATSIRFIGILLFFALLLR